MCLMIVQEEIRTQSIISEDCPCIFHPLSSATVVSSVSPLLLTQHPVMLRDTAESRLDSFILSPLCFAQQNIGGVPVGRGGRPSKNIICSLLTLLRRDWNGTLSSALGFAVPCPIMERERNAIRKPMLNFNQDKLLA